MLCCRYLLVISSVVVMHAGCSSSSGGDDDDDSSPAADASTGLSPQGACAHAAYVGFFEASLLDGYTVVQGKLQDSVTPYQVADVAATDGDCQLLRPPSLFCDPACGAGETCDATGSCVAAPQGATVGEVTIEGMSVAVQMSANPPFYYYNFTGSLPHPGFVEGGELTLHAAGEAPVQSFSLGVYGIAALTSSSSSVLLERDAATQVTWAAPGMVGVSTVAIELNIAKHGGTQGRIECEVPDTGQFEIPVSLTNQLLDSGYSGYPELVVTRHSVDSTTTAVGCIEFAAQAQLHFEVQIDGLISCSNPSDCPDGQSCQPDLTCG